MIATMKLSRWALPAALVLAVIGLGFGLRAIIDVLMFEWRGPMNNDAFIYMAVGRGIVNGIEPYVGLFESKPPMMFLLMALSLAVTGSELLALWLEMTIVVAMPALVAWWMWERTRRVLATVVAFLFATIVMLRLEQIGTGLQTELFGAAFGSLYVLLILWKPEGLAAWPMKILAGFLIALTLMTKEPFLLALIAVSLLVHRSWRDAVRDLILPLFIAGGMILFFLLVTGWWDGYFSLYLPAMIFGRIGDAGSQLPLWFKATWTGRFFTSMTIYSPIPLFGYVMGGAFAVMLIARAETSRLLDRLLVVAGVLLIAYGFIYVTQLTVLHYNPSGEDVITMSELTRYWQTRAFFHTLIVVALLGWLTWRNPRLLIHVGCGVLALIALCFAFGIGDYTGNDAALVFPAYFAAIMICLDRMFGRGGIDAKVIGGATTAVLLAALVTYVPISNDTRSQYFGSREQYQEFSSWLDTLLEGCGSPSYGWHGGMPPFAYAKQSPIGPIFSPYFHDYLGFDHPLYVSTWENLKQAQVMLRQPFPYKGTDPLQAAFWQNFDTARPRCAQTAPEPTLEGVEVFYRKAEAGGTLY